MQNMEPPFVLRRKRDCHSGCIKCSLIVLNHGVHGRIRRPCKLDFTLVDSGLVFRMNGDQSCTRRKNRVEGRFVINQECAVLRPMKILMPQAGVAVLRSGRFSAVAPMKKP